MRKSKRFLLPVGALTALIVLAAAGRSAWAYLINPCDVGAVKEASAFLTRQLQSYDDLYQFTTTVYPDGLDSPVRKLQQIFMETQAVEVPVCMQAAKGELLEYMGTVIRAFQAYAAGEEGRTLRDLIDQANTHYGNFRSELQAVNACAPFCFP